MRQVIILTLSQVSTFEIVSATIINLSCEIRSKKEQVRYPHRVCPPSVTLARSRALPLECRITNLRGL